MLSNFVHFYSKINWYGTTAFLVHKDRCCISTESVKCLVRIFAHPVITDDGIILNRNAETIKLLLSLSSECIKNFSFFTNSLWRASPEGLRGIKNYKKKLKNKLKGKVCDDWQTIISPTVFKKTLTFKYRKFSGYRGFL